MSLENLYHSSERTESNQYDMRYKILYENDYISLLKKVGFRNVHIYGNYDIFLSLIILSSPVL